MLPGNGPQPTNGVEQQPANGIEPAGTDGPPIQTLPPAQTLPEPPTESSPPAPAPSKTAPLVWTDGGYPTGPLAHNPPTGPADLPQSVASSRARLVPMLDTLAPEGSPVEWSDAGTATGPAAATPSSPGQADQLGLGASPSPSPRIDTGPGSTPNGFAQAGPGATGYGSTLGASGLGASAGVSGSGIMPLGAGSGDGMPPVGGAASNYGTSPGGGAASGYGTSAGATQNPYSWGSASPQTAHGETSNGVASPSARPGILSAMISSGLAGTVPAATSGPDGSGSGPDAHGETSNGVASPSARPGILSAMIPSGLAGMVPTATSGPDGSGSGPDSSPSGPAGEVLPAAVGPINQEQASEQLQQHQAQIKQAQELEAEQSKALQAAQDRIDKLQAAVNEQSLEEQEMQEKLQELMGQEGTRAQSSQLNQRNHQSRLDENESQASEFHNIHQQRIQDILNNLQNPNEHRYGPDGMPISSLPPDYPFSTGQPGLSVGLAGQSGTQLPGQFGAEQAVAEQAAEIAHQPGSLLTEAEIRQEQMIHNYGDELRQNMYQQTSLQHQLDLIEAQEQALKVNENLTPQQKEQVNQQLMQIKSLRRQFKQNQALLQKQQKQLETLQKTAARNERDEAKSTTYLFDDPFMHFKGPQMDPLCNDPFMTHAQKVDPDRHAYQAPLAGTDPFLAHGPGMPLDRHVKQAPVAADPFMAHGPGLPLDRPTNITPVAGDPFLTHARCVGEDVHAKSEYPVAADPMMDHGWTLGVPPVQDRRKDKDIGVAADPFMVHRVPINADGRTPIPVAVDPFLTRWLSRRPMYDAINDKRANMYPLAKDPFMTHNRYPAGKKVPEYIVEDVLLMKGQRPNIPANVAADPFLTKDEHMRKDLNKDPFLTRTMANDKNRCAYEDLKVDPLLCKMARLQVDVVAGCDKLEVDTTNAFRVNMAICINPGGANEEVCVIRGFGSILLQRPLKLGHTAGEAVVPVVQVPHYAFQERVDQVLIPVKEACAGACRTCEFGMIACFGKMGRATKRTCHVCGGEIGTIPTEFYVQPWLVFTFFLFSGLGVGHFYPTLNANLVILFSFLCVIRIVAWFVCGRRLGTLNRANMAVMCLFATIAAVFTASMFWSLSVRQWWWLRTGVRYDMSPYTSATQSALSRADAAWLQFQDGSASYPASLVDTSRSAGYVDGSVYCVAPILNSEALSTSSLTLVQYWALGINCCEPDGSFMCGDSRSPKGKYGIVMVGSGGSCAGCNKEKFAAAVQKAESLYGLVSAEGALMVKWVDDPSKELNSMSLNLCLSVLIVLLIGVWVAVGVAWILFRIEKSIWDRQPRAGYKPPQEKQYGVDGLLIDAYGPFRTNARVEVMKDLRKLDSVFST